MINGQAVRNALSLVERRWMSKNKTIQIDNGVDNSTPIVHVMFLYFPDELRRKGYGRQVLSEILKVVDSFGYEADIYPDASFGTDIAVLENFYASMGFAPMLNGVMTRTARSSSVLLAA
jgi:GNAT superfamily N-acetyltransferase